MIMLRIMHMENEECEEILTKILNNPSLLRDYIKNEFKKENKTNKEKIEAVQKTKFSPLPDEIKSDSVDIDFTFNMQKVKITK